VSAGRLQGVAATCLCRSVTGIRPLRRFAAPRVYYSTAYSLASSFRPPVMADMHTSQEIAAHLFANAEFRSLQLGTWLNTPNGQLITAAVEALTPPPYREDIQLLVEAVSLAAKMQQDAGRERAIAAGLVLAFGGALLAAGKS
jgi:hypothetical protein